MSKVIQRATYIYDNDFFVFPRNIGKLLEKHPFISDIELEEIELDSLWLILDNEDLKNKYIKESEDFAFKDWDKTFDFFNF
jgi:hypothetical protein